MPDVVQQTHLRLVSEPSEPADPPGRPGPGFVRTTLPDRSMPTGPVVVTVLSRSAIVRLGIEALLTRSSDRMTVRRGNGDVNPDGADVVLLEVSAGDEADRGALEHLAGWPAPVVTVVDAHRPDLASFSLAQGARLCVRPDITGAQLVRVLETVARTPRGQDLVALPGLTRPTPRGLGVGLSARELEVVTGVVDGRSNQDIADSLFLSINSVKTYVRTAYRKIGVDSRSQAVAWGIRNGIGTAGETRGATPAWTGRS